MDAYWIGRKHHTLPWYLACTNPLSFISRRRSLTYREDVPGNLSETSAAGMMASSIHLLNAFKISSSEYICSLGIIPPEENISSMYKRVVLRVTYSVKYICLRDV